MYIYTVHVHHVHWFMYESRYLGVQFREALLRTHTVLPEGLTSEGGGGGGGGRGTGGREHAVADGVCGDGGVVTDGVVEGGG